MLEGLTSIHWAFIGEIAAGVFVGLVAYNRFEWLLWRRTGVELVVKR
jgi:hypothetical protein